MPEYLYQNPETEEVISIMQGMNDEHKFLDDNGLEWNRIFTNPTMSIDSQDIDPFSEQQFVEKNVLFLLEYVVALKTPKSAV